MPDGAQTLEEALAQALPGDVITLEAGKYYGPVYLPEGVTIEGAGAADVSIRARAASGPVVIAEDNTSGTITGVTIEHTNRNSVDFESRYESPVLKIIDANITVTDCVIKGSAGDGIHIEGFTKARIVNTECIDNYWDGIFVTGESAEPEVIASKCIDNGDDGIHVAAGARGTYTDTVSEANYTDGFAVTDNKTHPVIDGHTSNENGYNGMSLFPGASATVSSSSFLANEVSGIWVAGFGGTIRINVADISMNQGDGVEIWAGGVAEIRDASISGNEFSGVYVSGFGSSATIGESRIADHGDYGVYADAGARIIVRVNEISSSAKGGIIVHDPGTQFENADNTFDDNENAVIEARTYPTSQLVNREQLAYMLREQKFDEVDAFTDWIYEIGGYDSDGIPNIARLNSALDAIVRDRRFDNVYGVDFFDQWNDAQPNSVSKTLIESWVSFYRARRAKASEDKPKRKIQELLDRAGSQVNSILETQPNHVGALYLDLLIAIEREETPDEIRARFDSAMAVDGEYVPFMTIAAWRLSPYFDMEVETFQAFLSEMDDQYAKEPNLLYARVAASFLAFDQPDGVLELEFDYERTMDGFEKLLVQFPESKRYLNAMCYMAAIQEDATRAAPLFQDIGDDFDEDFWGDADGYYDWYDWAVDGGAKPGTPYGFLDEVGLSPAMAPLILLGFAGVFFLIFVGMCAGVVYLMRKTA